MRFFFPPQINSILRPGSVIGRWSFGKLLVLLGTAVMVFILAISFLTIYGVVSTYLGEAFSRNAQLRALAQADAIGRLLDDARFELEYLSRGPLSAESMLVHFNKKTSQERNRYREVGFQGIASGDHFVLVNSGEAFVALPSEQMHAGRGGDGIFTTVNKGAISTGREIRVGEPVEAVYAALPVSAGVRNVSTHVIRLTMAVFGPEDRLQGQLILSLDLLEVRDILSLHASDQSPLFLFPQDNERKQSFTFDLAGWLLFESENLKDRDKALAVDRLRVGLQGDVGRPGFKEAFRPSYDYKLYWTLVSNVQSGQSGQLLTSRFFAHPQANEQSLFLSYSPILFNNIEGQKKIIGGIGCFDSSSMLAKSKKKVFNILFLFFIGSILIFFFLLSFIGGHISRNIDRMAHEIEKKLQADDQNPFEFYSAYAELNQFQKAINILLYQLYMARREILQRTEIDEEERLRQKINLNKEIASNVALNQELLRTPLHGIIGGSAAIAQLRQQIHKAAGVLADVLIIGETGTGKELTAGAIHAVSYRANGPFISISCGALDENLLMDALFGHVKGAHSEAQSDRKGAFLAASGGTLLLDEIGNASVRVQQALLRALSVRRIIPLGSDQEIAFDARIIAATNVDLLQSESSTQSFREDLYYRLAVLTINTPPLRKRKEDLPVLLQFFLEEICQKSGRTPPGVSRGALDKIMQYSWPGNVRELKNCLIRSFAFVEGDVLLAEHILFNEPIFDLQGEDQQVLSEDKELVHPVHETVLPLSEGTVEINSSSLVDGKELNERQEALWPLIVKEGSISRGEYQQALENSISVRTAQYDLSDFVKRGMLVKSGRGPACRYKVVE